MIAGEVSDRIEAAIRLARRAPGNQADTLPYALQWPELDAAEQGCATVAEIAEVRWLDIAKACDYPDRAAPTSSAVAEILAADLLRRGFGALAFDPDGRALRIVAQCSDSNTAAWLATRLAGRVYLVPFGHWSLRRADVIRADLRREQQAGCPLQGFQICGERIGLRAELAGAR